MHHHIRSQRNFNRGTEIGIEVSHVKSNSTGKYADDYDDFKITKLAEVGHGFRIQQIQCESICPIDYSQI